MQVKLLRVLQEGTFVRVGGEQPTEVDVRVISATHKNLDAEIAAGRFREDLFYRLCVVPITLPSLRERSTDIPLLADHFLQRTAEESGRERARVSQDALATLMGHSWPGNVRELQNALQFAMVKSRGDEIQPAHLPASVLSPTPEHATSKKRRRRKLAAEDVAKALREAQGNKVKAAKLLGVSRATLYRFLDEQEEQRPRA